MEWFFYLLSVQAVMGAVDTLYHHEIRVALPRCVSARKELAVHAIRSLLYAMIFFSLSWFQWHGIWVLPLVVLILVEVALTLWDFVIEDRSRLLPWTERVLHTLLAINGGAAFCLLALELPGWYSQANAMVPAYYGWPSWFLSLAAMGVGLSGLRDAWAAWTVQRLDLQLKLFAGRRKRFLISGATGFIGSALCRELLAAGHELVLLSRDPLAAAIQFQARVRCIRHCRELSHEESFDVVINLAGAPVAVWPWTSRRRRVLQDSRFRITDALVDYVSRAEQPPSLWIQASAVGFYGTQAGRDLDESSDVGEGFAADLCDAWEQRTQILQKRGIRRVVLRFGLVFGRGGGVLPTMILAHRLGAGANVGDGLQHVSWIHIEDLLRVMARCIDDVSVDGVINAVAPESPSYQQFARMLSEQLRRPLWFRFPKTLLKILLGEMADLFVEGPVVRPQRLLVMHFDYHFPSLRSALMDLS